MGPLRPRVFTRQRAQLRTGLATESNGTLDVSATCSKHKKPNWSS